MERLSIKPVTPLIRFQAALPLILLFAAGMVQGASSGKIAGNVINAAEGIPVPAANIFISARWDGDVPTDIETSAGAATDDEGDYFIINLPPGTYSLTCQSMGFARSTVEKVIVYANRTTRVNFELQQSTMELSEVVVTARQEIIQQDVSGSKYHLKAEAIESLPLEGLDEVLSTQLGVGVQSDANGAGFRIRGGGIDETDVIIDGMSLMNQRTGVAISSVNMTSIEEIEILSGGFNAEFGTVRSGVINIVTKEAPEQFSFSGDFRYSHPARKHFGPSPYSPEGPFWKVYAGDKAFTGVTAEDVASGEYPFEFIGWNQVALNNAKDNVASNDYTPQEALEIWKWRHREIEYADEPDIIADFTVTTPVNIPLVNYIMWSQRIEESQYYLPASRKSYLNTITQLKMRLDVSENARLDLNNLFYFEEGVGGHSVYEASPAVLNGSREAVASMSYMFNSPYYLWAEGAYNPIENHMSVHGINFSYVISPATYYDLSVEYTRDETSQEPMEDRDTTGVILIGDTWYDETPRGHAGTGSETWDQLNQCIMGGLGRGQNHSNYNSINLSGTLVSQINKYHQIKTGFNLLVSDFEEREMVNSSGVEYTYSENPSDWIYYNESPVTFSAYVQDKLEFEGMVANFGLRLDYFNPRQDAFDLSNPFDEDGNPLIDNFNAMFYEQYASFDSLRTDGNTGKYQISPRLGISHPISDVGKIYFNYGHFYQVPQARYYYNVRPQNASHANIIPNLDLDWEKTIQYEIGYEHNISDRYLLHFGAYYKDVSNEIVPFEIRDGEMGGLSSMQIETWANNQYADYRGVELRFEKNRGRYLTFYATLEYAVNSWGRTGEFGYYEDEQFVLEQKDLYEQNRNNAVPSFSLNVDLHTPEGYGPKMAGFYPLEQWRISTIFGWSDGGEVLYDPNASLSARHWMEIKDWSNTDMMIEKKFRINGQEVLVYAQINNLFNQKRLSNIQNYISYLSSLHLPWESGEQNGNDQYGNYEADYLDLGWYEWTQFLNPRDVYIGIRISF